jgi:hypothetical protein
MFTCVIFLLFLVQMTYALSTREIILNSVSRFRVSASNYNMNCGTLNSVNTYDFNLGIIIDKCSILTHDESIVCCSSDTECFTNFIDNMKFNIVYYNQISPDCKFPYTYDPIFTNSLTDTEDTTLDGTLNKIIPDANDIPNDTPADTNADNFDFEDFDIES